MFLAFIVWLVMTALPELKIIGFIISLVFGLCVLGTILFGADSYGEDKWNPLKAVWRQAKWVIPVFFLTAFLPNERTTWYMVGAYTTQSIAESATGKELANDGVDVLKSLMKKAKEKIDNYDTADAKKEEPKK